LPQPAPKPGRRLGVIDIGSNSVRFVIYGLYGSAFFPIYNEKVLAGLGRDLRETGRLSETGKQETLRALKRFRALVDARLLSPVLIAATAAMRDGEDAPDFRERVEDVTRFDIKPTSGREEARLAALGVLAGDRRSQGLVCDLGGASLEFVQVAGGKVGDGVTTNLGPFQVMGDDLTEDFDAARYRQTIDTALSSIDLGNTDTAYLVGGAWRNLMKVHQERTGYPLAILQGYSLPAQDALEFCRWAYGEGRAEVAGWSGISARRRETLPYGALALEAVITHFAPRQIRVSATGLREGLVADYLGELRNRRSPLIDGCRDLARGNLQAEGFATPLGRFLAPIDQHLPSAFDPENEARLRKAARHLAGMGKGLHPDYRAELVFEQVLYAPIAGLLHSERAYLAHIMHNCYTFALTTSDETAVEHLLTANQRRAARIYGAAIRLAVAACGRTPELLSELSLSWDGSVSITAQPSFKALEGMRTDHRLGKLNSLLQDLEEETEDDSED